MYEQEKKFLAETAAIRVAYWSNPQTGDAILTRRWTTSRVELQASCFDYLNTIKIVTNPKADGRSYPGTWRVVPNQGGKKRGLPEEEQGITQTLSKIVADGGMRWASMDSTLECMYSYSYRNMTAPVQTETAEQGVVTEARNTLNEQYLYDAEARRMHSHPYLWPTHVSENALSTGDNLGYKNYRERPEAPASTVQGTIYDAKSTMNKDGSYDGDVAYETSKVKLLTGAVAESYLTVGYEYAYLNSRTRPVMPGSLVQGVVYEAKSTVNKDNTYNGAVAYEASKPAAWSDVTESVTGTECANSYLNYKTKPAAPTAEAIGFIYDAKLTMNKDGTYSGGVGYEYSKPAEWYDLVQAALSASLNHSYLNQRDKVSAPTVTAQGFLYDAKSTLNKDGTYNGNVGYEYSKEAGWSDVTQTATGISAGNSYLNYRTKPSAPTAVAVGFVYDAKTTLNKDGTYTGGVGYEYSKEAAWTDLVQSATGISADNSYVNYRTKPAAPTDEAQGFLYDAKTTLNKDGTYSGGVNYEYSKPLAWADATETALSSSVANSYQNYRTRPSAPSAAAQGFIYDAKTTTNKDGTYSGGVNYEYSKPDAWTDVTESALTSDVAYSYLNYRTRPAAPSTAVQGFLYDAKTTDNKDGTYSGGVGYSYSKPVQMAAQTLAGAYQAGYEVSYLHSRSIPTAPSTVEIGTVYEAKTTINKDGSYTGAVGYEYAAPVELYLTWYSNEGLKGLRKYMNWREIPSSIAALTDATENSVELSYSPRTGAVDATVRITADTSGGTMSGVSISTSLQTSYERQVIGYNYSTQKWTVQQWSRNEQFCKDRAAAVTVISGNNGTSKKERTSITYTHVVGGYWIAVYYQRVGAPTEMTSAELGA